MGLILALEDSLSPSSPSRRRRGFDKPFMKSNASPAELDFLDEPEAMLSPSRRRGSGGKLLLESRSPIFSGELEGPSSPLRRRCRGDKLLMDVFGAFAFGREQMFPKDFERLCFTCSLFDSKFMKPDARRIFGDQLVKGQRSIGPEQFAKLTHEIAFERECYVGTVHDMMTKAVKSTRCPRGTPKCASSALDRHQGEHVGQQGLVCPESPAFGRHMCV